MIKESDFLEKIKSMGAVELQEYLYSVNCATSSGLSEPTLLTEEPHQD